MGQEQDPCEETSRRWASRLSHTPEDERERQQHGRQVAYQESDGFGDHLYPFQRADLFPRQPIAVRELIATGLFPSFAAPRFSKEDAFRQFASVGAQ